MHRQACGSDTELCQIVLNYAATMKRLVDQAKQPGFSAESWAPLGECVAQAEFRRVGVNREVHDWRQYTAFLTQWATVAEWESRFRRIHEWNGVVFLELEEHNRMGDQEHVINSLSVYAFDDNKKLRQLDVYMQSPAFAH